MTQSHALQILTVGWDYALVEGLWDAIAAKCDARFSHVLHPGYIRSEWNELSRRADIHFFRSHLRQPMPEADSRLLAALERPDVPTVHNMILGDRVVRQIDHDDALKYATFLARRLVDLFRETSPAAIIGGFDSIHSGLALAVARHMGIPWFALNFSVIPPGLACFCERMSPAARLRLTARPSSELRSFAEASLQRFESGSIQAPAYIAPRPASLSQRVRRLPGRLRDVVRTIRKAGAREHLKYTEGRAGHSVPAALRLLHRASGARKAIEKQPTLAVPPSSPYVLFGLHFQPESSIDVWAPFFSNQMWVIELLSRSIPPSHRLLVKIHKSDVANYSTEQLTRMRGFPGVELVRPFANTRTFIEDSDLIVAIQGTMGLEGALLGKRVIMLGDSPVAVFPSVSSVGEISNLPQLIRDKLAESPPSRREIVDAYATYLAPFTLASHNDWTAKVGEREIEGYGELFGALTQYLATRSDASMRKP